MRQMHLLLPGLLALLWLPAAWGDSAAVREECLDEPIFEGKVCTAQANPGAAQGVILIHGLNGSIADWQHTLPALAEDFHVLAFDLPGFGKSDKGSQEYSPTRYARLAHFLAGHYFGAKPYHIVGHSMGGAIALRFAAQRPLHFQRLALIDAAGILHPQVISKFQAGSLLERNSGISETRGFAERLSGKLLEQVDRLPLSPTDLAQSALGRDHVLRGGPQPIAALGLAGEDFSAAIAAVGEPTLILWGDRDLVVPLRTGQVLAARLPQARLHIVTGAGHEPMRDQSEEVNELLRQHLLAEGPLPRPAARRPFTSQRIGRCEGESGRVFKGDYLRLELRDCSDITLRNARVGHLSLLNTRLQLVDTDILGREEGVHAENSDVTITNGDIAGDIAIYALRSRFDIAGAHLRGTRAAVKAVDSKFVFSVSRVRSPHNDGTLHNFFSLRDDEL